MRAASIIMAPSRVAVDANNPISHGFHSLSGSWYVCQRSYGHRHMPILCSQAVLRINVAASVTAFRRTLPTTMGTLGRRSVTPQPHVRQGFFGYRSTSIRRHGAPSPAPSDLFGTGGLGHDGASMGPEGNMSRCMLHPFGGLSVRADTAGGGGSANCSCHSLTVMPGSRAASLILSNSLLQSWQIPGSRSIDRRQKNPERS